MYRGNELVRMRHLHWSEQSRNGIDEVPTSGRADKEGVIYRVEYYHSITLIKRSPFSLCQC